MTSSKLSTPTGAAIVDRDTASALREQSQPDPLPLAGIGPRERLQLLGEARLSDAECLALILRTGTRGIPAETLARQLLVECGGLAGLAGCELAEIARIHGVGPTRAGSIRAAFGLARRLIELRFRPGSDIRHSSDVARIVREVTRSSGRESFHALHLDTRHRVIGMRVISLGSLQSAPVHPREVFRPAIRDGSAAIVVAHNHPSGDPKPSPEDRLVTERLRQVGGLVGIELLDHLVVGADRYFSFADNREHGIDGAQD